MPKRPAETNCDSVTRLEATRALPESVASPSTSVALSNPERDNLVQIGQRVHVEHADAIEDFDIE